MGGEYELAFEALQRRAQICLQFNNEADMANCLENIAKFHWRLNPGNLESVRWLATAASWRDTASQFAEDQFDSRFLEKGKDQDLKMPLARAG